MNKSKIDWCDYTINPVKGLCPMACPYCYARAMYKRFKWNPEIRFEWDFTPPRKPSRIFVGSTMELFGEWVPDSWLRNIFNFCSQWPEHTFLFLTKQPQNLIKFSPFPDNCWVGVTITNNLDGLSHMKDIEAKVKFISFEPLQYYNVDPTTASTYLVDAGIDWLIIGSQTRPYKPPKIEWVEEIVQAADKAGIPVFLKDNLDDFLGMKFRDGVYQPGGWRLKQEMPQ